MNPKCEVQGCRADATYTVGCNCHRGVYGAERHIIGVCSDCRDQMMEWGWELILPGRRGGSMNPTCDIDGCRQDAVATVRSNNSPSSKALAVCGECEDGWVYPAPHGVDATDCPAFYDICRCEGTPCPSCRGSGLVATDEAA